VSQRPKMVDKANLVMLGVFRKIVSIADDYLECSVHGLILR